MGVYAKDKGREYENFDLIMSGNKNQTKNVTAM